MDYEIHIEYLLHYLLQTTSYLATISEKNFLEFNTFMERESSVKFARGCSDK